jgi:hypothetical protein
MASAVRRGVRRSVRRQSLINRGSTHRISDSPRGVSQSVCALDFERFEEALHRCVIPAIAFPTHRLRHVKLLEKLAAFSTGVLTAAIRVHE